MNNNDRKKLAEFPSDELHAFLRETFPGLEPTSSFDIIFSSMSYVTSFDIATCEKETTSEQVQIAIEAFIAGHTALRSKLESK